MLGITSTLSNLPRYLKLLRNDEENNKEVDLKLQRKSSIHLCYSKKLKVCEQQQKRSGLFRLEPEKSTIGPMCLVNCATNRLDNILLYWDIQCCHHFVAYRCPPVKIMLRNEEMGSACRSVGKAFAPINFKQKNMGKIFLRRGRKNMSTFFDICMLTLALERPLFLTLLT